jgi:hypothetical protein
LFDRSSRLRPLVPSNHLTNRTSIHNLLRLRLITHRHHGWQASPLFRQRVQGTRTAHRRRLHVLSRTLLREAPSVRGSQVQRSRRLQEAVSRAERRPARIRADPGYSRRIVNTYFVFEVLRDGIAGSSRPPPWCRLGSPRDRATVSDKSRHLTSCLWRLRQTSSSRNTLHTFILRLLFFFFLLLTHTHIIMGLAIGWYCLGWFRDFPAGHGVRPWGERRLVLIGLLRL